MSVGNLIKKPDEGVQYVMVNGCFDLLHPGHLHFLRLAKYLCGYGSGYGLRLLVALNSDVGVQRLKGSNRPIVPENERVDMLAALDYVDCITLFDDRDASKVIKKFKPMIYVKGEEYANQDYPERKTVEEMGIPVFFVQKLPGFSSTETRERLKTKLNEE